MHVTRALVRPGALDPADPSVATRVIGSRNRLLLIG
jgi:hypothetical protein